MKIEVFFLSDGNTMVIDRENNRQMPSLQKAWIKLFADFLESNGIDPTEIEFNMPGIKERAAIFRTGKGWNWRFY